MRRDLVEFVGVNGRSLKPLGFWSIMLNPSRLRFTGEQAYVSISLVFAVIILLKALHAMA
jgi:hypothetical protein